MVSQPRQEPIPPDSDVTINITKIIEALGW